MKRNANQINKDFNNFKEKLEKEYKGDDKIREVIESIIDRRHNGEHIDVMIIARTNDDEQPASKLVFEDKVEKAVEHLAEEGKIRVENGMIYPVENESENVEQKNDSTADIEECEDECCDNCCPREECYCEDPDYIGCMMTDISNLTQEILQLKKLIMMQPVFFPEKGINKKDIRKWMKRAVKDSLDEMFEVVEAPETDPVDNDEMAEIAKEFDRKYLNFGNNILDSVHDMNKLCGEIVNNQRRMETYFTEQVEDILKRLSDIEKKLPTPRSKSSRAK